MYNFEAEKQLTTQESEVSYLPVDNGHNVTRRQQRQVADIRNILAIIFEYESHNSSLILKGLLGLSKAVNIG